MFREEQIARKISQTRRKHGRKFYVCSHGSSAQHRLECYTSAGDIRNIKSYFEKNGERVGVCSTSSRPPPRILHSLSLSDRRNARFAGDERRWMRKNSTSGCKSRKPSYRYALCSAILKCALISRLSRNTDCGCGEHNHWASKISHATLNQIVIHLASFHCSDPFPAPSDTTTLYRDAKEKTARSNRRLKRHYIP